MKLKTLTPAAFGMLVIISCLIACNTKTTLPYPTPAPGGTLASFLPGIVSTDSFEFNALFAPDGNAFYFSREDIHNIYVTKFNGSQWSAAELTSFSESNYKECDPAFSPDGNKLYYISTRPTAASDTLYDFNIWYVEKAGTSWSAPKNLEIVNTDSNEYYVSFAQNGNLYFASNRAGSLGKHDIYVSRFVNNEYTTPENLGEAVNTERMEHDPFISADETLLIFTGVDREGGAGRGDLYYSTRDANGNWSKAQNLGAPFNTPDYDFCPYITPDAQYFFYSDNKDIKWIEIEKLYAAVGRK